MDFIAEDMEIGKAFEDRNKLRVTFYMGTVVNQAKSREAGMPVFEDTVFVRKFVPGDGMMIVDTAAVIHKNHPNADNNLFPAQYAAFKRGEEQNTGGTPLSEFPALLASQRKSLEYMEIRTVEALADLSDANAQHGMGLSDLKRKARDFLDARKDSGHVLKMSAELSKANATAEKQAAEILEMRAALEALQAQAAKPATKPKQQTA